MYPKYLNKQDVFTLFDVSMFLLFYHIFIYSKQLMGTPKTSRLKLESLYILRPRKMAAIMETICLNDILWGKTCVFRVIAICLFQWAIDNASSLCLVNHKPAFVQITAWHWTGGEEGLVYWRVYASLGLDEFYQWCPLTHLPLEKKWPPFRRRYFQMPFFNERFRNLIKISLKFVPKGPIDNTWA